MLTKLDQPSKAEEGKLRQDMALLKECLTGYNTVELEVYLIPFQQVRITSNSTNSIQ